MRESIVAVPTRDKSDAIIQWCHDTYGPAAPYYGKLHDVQPRWHFIHQWNKNPTTDLCLTFKEEADATFFLLTWL